MTTKQVKSSRLLYGLALALVIILITGAIGITLLITKNQALTIEIQTVTQEREDKQKELEKLQKDHELSKKAIDGFVKGTVNLSDLCQEAARIIQIDDPTEACASVWKQGIDRDAFNAMTEIMKKRISEMEEE